MELDDAVCEGKKSKVFAYAYVFARVPFGAALADEDTASCDELTCRCFDAEALRVRVAAVSGRTLTFLMCHFSTFTQLRF